MGNHYLVIVEADEDYVSMAQSGVRFDDCLLI